MTRAARNQSIISSVRTATKRARQAIAQGDKKAAAGAVHTASVALAKAASKGVLHQKTASRTTSRIQHALNQLESQ